MAAKKSFPLRIDPQIYEALERWAGDEFRSVNGHIEYLLRESLIRAGRLPDPRRGEERP
ncbi:toxin-antitoxin system HicB family antitoxin [Paenibacillus sp. CN-4]|uniref:toxin-antitoxin system HicB family antitoxin n=1 Tax=Paenibacillus nanchangensis TaxID=3348343 RepID=UPI00397A9BED